ncbi:Retrovirus-related Pol polyprotein from transposon TNT 1-94 [Symbiodinium microadriaticum]|uniref:Retrovirus-related Pol polyprotein from transposon TNT 1-94 n=1 Tax=Symbiodinium microadriaticum TaxID=2951 RepID=A0A1Q9C596_SYMMI|nr:Retrovirus-related Pol polyprotein from transposon TNT 1-94 [Symbiodinium microadriaticum]
MWLKVMSPSSGREDSAPQPQMNGNGEVEPSGSGQEVETGAVCSGLGVEPRSEQLQDARFGGGGDNGGSDVAGATEALPSTATSAGQLGGVPLETYRKQDEDPLLFQGSRARTDIAVQDGSSGDGSAGHGGDSTGAIKQFTWLDYKDDPGVLPKTGAEAWRAPLGALWNELSGKRSPEVATSRAEPLPGGSAQTVGGGIAQQPDSTNAMMEILARSMSQLQDIQARSLQKGLDDEAPEAVKSSVPVLPLLTAPEGVSTGIVLQDWLAQIAIAMQDLSPSSGVWWSKVMDVVHSTYTRWLGSTPLERLQLQPHQYGSLAEGKWTRVNARACSMLLQSLTETVKQDMISRRVVQHAALIMFRLHTMYQPGGASEKTLVLGNLQTPNTCASLDDALTWLRAWPRWIQRCQDLNMMCPDGTVLSKALTTVTSRFIAEGPDAQFRTQLLRSTLRIDGQPSLEDVKRYHQHLQAELESAAAARTVPAVPVPKLHAMGATGNADKPQAAATSSAGTKQPCKYFFKPNGCRRGQKCPYGHDMGSLSKAERSKKCLVCGAEDHRQRECPTKAGRAMAKPSSPVSATHGSQGSNSTGPRVQSMEPEGETSPTAVPTTGVVTGELVWTIESLLEAATKMTAAKAAATQGPSINVISLNGCNPMCGSPQTYALVDSGATHALRRAKSLQEWESSSPVTVNLAGGGSVALRMNSAGTILVPESSTTTSTSSSPIVPLGALVQQLDYSMTWSGTRCRLEGRNGEVLNLRVRDGCPEIAERDALRLIAKLEDNQLEELKSHTKDTRRRVKAAALMMERTWFDYLQSYVRSGISTEALQSISAAPFLRDVPQQCVSGLVETVPELNGWEALKGLQHLNRRTRKRLWSSDRWVVHLFAGERKKDEIYHLELHGYTILELDISLKAGGTGRRHARLEHPAAFVLSSDLAGPVKLGGVDPDARGAYPKAFKYIFVAKLRIPKTFVDDGRGTWVSYDEGDLAEEEYKETDDGLELEKEGKLPPERVGSEEPAHDGSGPPEEDEPKRLSPEEDLDLAPPELVNLIFASGLRDDKAATVLEAIQDVVLYCQALNIPILRFHSDRGMEFQARATKQWLKGQGIRVTTSEAGVHQTNGAAESTVRWVKQRARTLLLSAGLPQHVWPTAVSTAAILQRSDVLGFEPILAAPYGSKVMVRKRQLEGPKPDDLAPKWVQGVYVGRSESLSKGHLVFVKDDEGEKFIHTLHVRAGLHDPGSIEDRLETEEPVGPERRVRGKSSSSGDVVTLSKAMIFDDKHYQEKIEALLSAWSQEEAEAIVKEVCQQLPPSENVYGMFRHGGKTGITRATAERPWFARLLLRLLCDKAPDAEFASIYVSVNNEREMHIDRNNAMGTLNYLLPIVMPRRGGEIWQELRNGDVVHGKVLEIKAQDGQTRYGCAFPLEEGKVFHLNPHRRHAVLPSAGNRLVIVGYTPGVLQNLKTVDRECLWNLGFPMPLVDEDGGGGIRMNMFSLKQMFIGDEAGYQSGVNDVAGKNKDDEEVGPPNDEAASCGVDSERWLDWDMRLFLEEGQSSTAELSPDVTGEVWHRKAEVGFTENIEQLLEGLQAPLSIVHTVNPREASQCFERWLPSLQKEVKSLEHAVERVSSYDEQVVQDLQSGRGQMIPMKVVFTIKPPDPAVEGQTQSDFYKRKSRVVVCGNMASHQPGEVYTHTAPAEVVRAAIALARMFSWNLGMIDVVAAFLQTPLKELKGAPLVYGIPPKALVKDESNLPGGPSWETGWLIFLNDCVIAWKSGRQSTITLSTAEAELTAMSEAVLALQSADAMVKDVLPQGQPLQIYSDSTAALAIANGSGSWRTRHLRLRSAWVAELVEKQAISIHHCIGELQPADLLTKALASQRIRALNELLNLRSLEGAQNYVNNASTNTGSSSARAPNQVSRVLIALLVLSQAFLGETHSWEEEEALVVRTGMSVDYGMITWALLWLAVIVILVSWEMLKWFMWLVYDRATPGSTSRRLKRLQKLREATAEAIQKEVQLRTTTKGEQRARDAATEPLGQLPNPPRGTRTLSSSGREGRMTQDERDQLLRKVARGMKQYQDCGVQAGFTECTPSQQVRVILRYVHEPPGEAFFVPGNECYHVYGDCHAFRHRGTMGRVENRRIYQYCVNRARDDPDKSAEYGRDLERAQEYERIFNTQLRVSGKATKKTLSQQCAVDAPMA